MEKFFFIEYCVLHGIAFLMIGYISIVLYKQKNKHKNESKNKVHFYVARDQNESLWLYIGKPRLGTITYRPTVKCEIIGGIFVFLVVGLDENDYANLKFGDEPVEVFLNMEE